MSESYHRPTLRGYNITRGLAGFLASFSPPGLGILQTLANEWCRCCLQHDGNANEQQLGILSAALIRLGTNMDEYGNAVGGKI